MTPLLLGVLALVLADPVPRLLLALPRLRRTPMAALVLWQAIALAAVLAALGAGVSLVTLVALGDGEGPPGHPVAAAVGAAAVAALTLTVAARLLLSGHRVGTELRTLRRRHREQVDLVAARERDGLHVLEHALPVAWCLPGMAGRRVVVSRGLLETLSGLQADAVVAHERGHLRARHDLVLEAFTALHRAFPRWRAGERALREVALLVEVLADRAAARRHGPRPLAEALVAVASSRQPHGTLGVAGHGGAGDSHLLTRVTLVGECARHPVQWLGVVLVAVLLLVLPTLLVVLPWLVGLPWPSALAGPHR